MTRPEEPKEDAELPRHQVETPSMGDEPQHFLGMPTDRIGPRAGYAEEPQRVLGVPLDWFKGPDTDWVRWFAHPIHSWRQWRLRRRLGPYAPDEQDQAG